MAIQDQSIETRMNKMTSNDEKLNEVVQQIDPKESVAEVMTETVSNEEQVLDKEPVFVETEEPIQVAGLGIGKYIPKILKKDIDPVLKKRMEPTRGTDEYLIIPNATQSEIDEVLTKQAEQSINAKPGNVSYKGNKKTSDYGKFNVNFIEDSDGVKQFINAVGEVYQGEKTFTSLEDVKKAVTGSRYLVYKEGKLAKRFESQDEANAFINKQKDKDLYNVESKAPYDMDYIERLLDPKNPTIADPEEAYRMLVTQLDVTNRAEMLARKIVEAEQAGNVTPAMRVEFDQTLALAGEISKAVEKKQADYGRTLRMFGEIRKSDGGKQMQEFIAEHGGEAGSTDRAVKFLALQRTQDKAKMASNVFGYKAVKDIWLSTWINGLLSGPTTHIRNMTSNALFGVYQFPERFMTSAVGKIRSGITGSDDYIRANAIIDQAQGYFGSMIDAGRLAGKAFKENRSFDGMSKIELDKMRMRDEFDIDFGDHPFAKATSNAVRMWGKFVTVPGRALVAEDEFFKAISYSGEFRFLTKQRAEQFYSAKLKEGIDPEKAREMTTDYLTELRTDPPREILEAATDKSKELTFTKELDGFMRDFQQLTNNNKYPVISPLMKMFFPFVRTPTNLVMEAGKRSPLQLINPNFYKTIAKGGVEADAAIAKATMGSTMIGSMAYFGMGGNLTGSGPTNLQQRKTLEATGWQPYSIVFKKGELSDAEIEEYKTMTPVSIGDDNIYISYQGLQPVSTLLAIGSTIGEYFTYNSYAGTNNLSTLEQADDLVMVSTMAIYNFISELPVLQGYTEMTDILAGDPQSRKGAFMNFFRKGVKKVADVAIGGSPLGAWSSAQSTAQRSMDLTKRSMLPEEGGVPSGIYENALAAWGESWKRYTSRNPFYNNDMPEILDPMTAEPITVGKNWGSAFNPYKRSDGSISPEYDVLLRNGVPVYNPPRKVHGYELSADQYNMWIDLAVNDYQVGDRLLRKDAELQRENDLGLVQRTLRRQMTEAYTEALDELKTYFPELEMHLEDKDLQAAVEGLYSYY